MLDHGLWRTNGWLTDVSCGEEVTGDWWLVSGTERLLSPGLHLWGGVGLLK